MAPATSVLALLSPTVAQCPSGAGNAKSQRSDQVFRMFGAAHAGTISLQFGDAAALRYNGCGDCNRQFASCDDVFCVFTGSLDNLCQLRLTYGLKSRCSEANLIVEMYKALRDRAPFPMSHAIAELRGNFTFILYDHRDKASLIAVDPRSKYPLYWGTCQDGTLALSDDVDVLREGCSSSFAPFPAGCFFATSSGLKSYEHPTNSLKAVPHVDSATGQVCGSCFVVDTMSQVEHAARHAMT